ncbi:MAG: hypothetical protein ABW196_00130 [Solirubrobacterales bacterium]
MLNGPKRQIAAGTLLLVIAIAGLGAAGGRWLLLETHRHVVVQIKDIDGVADVFLNCRLAASAETGEPVKTVDLGWLAPDDRIFISVTSNDPTPAWKFTGTSNGARLFHPKRGSAAVPTFGTTAHALVFAEAFTAAGAELGPVGCQPPNTPAEKEFELTGYAWSPDEWNASGSGESSGNGRHNGFYDRVDWVGGWSLIGLAVLGAIAALLTPSIRNFAWSPRHSLLGAAIALFAAMAIESWLPTILVVGGIALLVLAALLAIRKGIVGLGHAESASSETGAQQPTASVPGSPA